MKHIIYILFGVICKGYRPKIKEPEWGELLSRTINQTSGK